MRRRLYFVAIFLIGIGTKFGYGQYSEEVVAATQDFLNSLKTEERESIQYELEDSLRTRWTNFPVGMEKRPGIKIGDVSDDSKIKFHQLLLTLFSSQGYLKATSIMKLDDMLNMGAEVALERGMITKKMFEEIASLEWDYNNFYVSVWNSPDMVEPWGLKFEGHHLSVNLSMSNTKISMTPLFLGADPAEMPLTKYAGLRVLSKEEDYGLRFVNSLDPYQKEIATLSMAVPEDIITNPIDNRSITEYYGIKGSQLTTVQQSNLEHLIREYVNNLEREKAQEALEKIQASGMENIYFAWIGSYERKKPHYYIIHTPDYIIEYDNVGFQKDGNHIHTIWREKKNDFGEDILKAHYEEHKH